jgi:6-phospho-beta-glucosidase
VRATNVIFPELCVVGVCELPWTTLKAVCDLLGTSPNTIRFDYAGINHVGWFYDIHLGSRDLVYEYCKALEHQRGFPTAGLIRQCSGVPLKYMRLHYEAADVLNEQRKRKQSRALKLQELSSFAFATYAAGDCDAVLGALRRRPAPWYEHCVGPLIRALTGERISTPFFLSTMRSEFDNEWMETDIFEMPCRYEGGSWSHIKPAGPVPVHIAKTLRLFVEYERIAAAAVIGRDLSLLEEAIRKHPWTGNQSVVCHIQRAIVEQPAATLGA